MNTTSQASTTSDSKVVLVTGASSGIGEATALRLARAGHRVLMGARRTERLGAIAQTLRAEGIAIDYRTVDVTDAADFTSFVQHAIEQHGRVDVLVNNAGVMPLSPLRALKTAEWTNMIDVNIRGVLHGIAAVLPGMEAQGGGHVVNVASIGAHAVFPGCAVYCGTKYAVWAITDGLRQESTTVRATIISPGVVESELANTITHPESQAAMVEFRKIALHPDAIARAIAYAIEQPADVDVSEIIVRPTAAAV